MLPAEGPAPDAPPPEGGADATLERRWGESSTQGRQQLMLELARTGAAGSFPVERAMLWSARLRTFGLAHACPLLAQAADIARPARLRILAAATAYRAFHDPRIRPPLVEAARTLSDDRERAVVRGDVERIAPELTADLDAAWGS